MKKIIKNNEVPLKAYLRGDSHSQKFVLLGENNSPKDLVTSDMFWGNSINGIYDKGLYLDYHKMIGRQITVSNGISEEAISHTKKNKDCDDWIDSNLLNFYEDKIIVIQGYAGSGKTTLMNHVINKISDKCFQYIDIGKDWTYTQEPYLFFNETLHTFDCCIQDVIKSNSQIRNKIWNKFMELLSLDTITDFNIELKNIKIALNRIKKNNKRWEQTKEDILDFLYENYSQKTDVKTPLTSKGQTEVIVSLIIILISAKKIIQNENKIFTIIFDDLDVITNPSIPSENVVILWGVIHKYLDFKENLEKVIIDKLPMIHIIINVRKVLYSHITSHLPRLEMNIHYNNNCINVCDISNLYLSQKILLHRIDYWCKQKNIDPKTKNNLSQIGKISNIHTDDSSIFFDNTNSENNTNNRINLDALFNHNYRAFANAMSELFEDETYYQYMYDDLSNESTIQNWQKVSTIIFCLSLLYRKKQIWNAMGFGCSSFETIDFPTTLNRLLLNCLFYSRYGQYLNDIANSHKNLPINDYLTLNDLVYKFSKSKFIKSSVRKNEKQNIEKYNNANNNTLDMVIERLADMCARNPASIDSKGYDSDDDELWRRPLFFIGGVLLNHTAITKNELYEHFKERLNENEGNQIKFLITDEGMVLIHDIIANFEFYSARYCKDSLYKPLHHIQTKKEVTALIKPVYNAIKKCISRHRIYMDDYMANYHININDYLSESFHPRTNPRFKNNENDDCIEFDSFRPQLHIVRVIYSHIAYFNDVKKLIFESSLQDRDEICVEITQWIKKYLLLYRWNYYELFDNTICFRDNNVFKDLIVLTKKQQKHYKTDMKNIDISLRKSNIYQND